MISSEVRQSFVETGVTKQEPKKRFVNFSELPESPARIWKEEVIKTIEIIRQEKECEGKACGEIMDSLQSSDFDEWRDVDKETSYTQLFLDSNSELIGFVVAWPRDSAFNKAPEGTNVVTIEKFGVVRQFRKLGHGTSMLHQLAEKAMKQKVKVDQIRALVYKTNQNAMTVYTHLGFDYVNKANDEPWDSWLLSVSPEVLFKKTLKS